jgi:hypothetical protein
MLRSPVKEAQLYETDGLFEGEIMEKLIFLAIRLEISVDGSVTENEYMPLTKFKNIQEIICVEGYSRERETYKFCDISPNEWTAKFWQSWVQDLKKELNLVKEHDKTWKLPVFTLCEAIIAL